MTILTAIAGSARVADLTGKRGLIVGIANEDSIAFGCARAMREAGAVLAATYLNAKAEPHVRPLAEALQCPILVPCDVREPGQLEAVFDEIAREWGQLDFIVHSIAFAPRADLHARVVDCSREGFLMAMDVSCHSLIRMTALAEPLMSAGGSIITVSFYGAEKVVPNYNLMGPVKAALQSVVRYLAAELAQSGIRVHAVSPGAIRTRAATGISRFDELLEKEARDTPQHQLAEIADVGAMAAFLASPAAARLTGLVVPVDGGRHIMS